MTVTTLTATYRVQFDPSQIDFDHAKELLDHLDALGISHVYASPLMTSRPGSTHGYDVVDPTTINPALGGREAFDRFVDGLHRHSMGLVLDIVPNHMAIGRANRWWMDSLAHGPASPRWSFFDFRGGDPIILPVLGRPYADVLSDGELRLEIEEATPVVAYWDSRFPLSPDSIDRSFPHRSAAALRKAVDDFNRDPEALHELLDAQHYRLAWWQLSRERLDHRRFFTITDLIGIKQEHRVVFEETHEATADLVRTGAVQGLRIDHIDGLRDPETYLTWLQELTGGTHVVVEKILAHDEELPTTWPVAGSTGYEYLDAAAKAFVDPDGYAILRSHYDGFAASPTDFERLVFDQQRFIIRERLGAETARFTEELAALARRDRGARDALSTDLIELAIDVVASLPVYRTYAARGEMSDADTRRVHEALELARERSGPRPERVERFIADLFTLRHGSTVGPEERAARVDFVERLQQFTGAVMAKGVEDTAFYQYNMLLSLNEVGGHPASLPPDPVAAYHEHNATVQASHPHTMTTATTHDTKRSEDVRHRISALSQFADEWVSKVGAWHVRNRVHRAPGAAGLAPTNNEELFVYQTLLGAWPLEPDPSFAQRIAEHLVKAAREAKVNTEWLEPDEEHETALTTFSTGLLSDEAFCSEMEEFGGRVWRAGALDSLAHTALRIGAPGAPDIYQGAELWDLSLTDPDNRRPVDWARRRKALTEVLHSPVSMLDLGRRWTDGTIKAAVLARGLRLRRSWPDVFLGGSYIPLAVEGDREEHAVAFARRSGDRWVVVAVPRIAGRLTEADELWPSRGWDSTRVLLPDDAPEGWRETMTDERITTDGAVPLGQVFGTTPVALLWATNDDDEEH